MSDQDLVTGAKKLLMDSMKRSSEKVNKLGNVVAKPHEKGMISL